MAVPSTDPAAQQQQRRDMPMQTRLAAVQPATIVEDKRTVELVWSTGARVRRYDFWSGTYYDEELSLDPAHVDLERLNGGAPLLDAHGTWAIEDVLGVVERAWIKDGEGRAIVRFSERELVEPIWRDVKAGIIRNISVGYQVRVFEKTEKQGEIAVWRAVDWMPTEISLVPVGADAGAGTRSAAPTAPTTPCIIITRGAPGSPQPERSMEDETQAAAGATQDPPAAPAPTPAPSDQRAQQQPQPAPGQPQAATIAEIRQLTDTLQLGPDYALDLAARNLPLDQARAAAIDELARRSAQNPTRPQITVGRDEVDTRRAAVQNALLHRYDGARYQLTDAAREYRGFDLVGLAREMLAEQGVRVRGLQPWEVAQRAMHSTSDFPIILGNTINQTLRDGYETVPQTFEPLVRFVNAPNFKDITRVQMGEISSLDEVGEHGEYTYATIGEGKEAYRIKKYGKIFAVTWETLVNDDLDAFTRLPFMFGQAAADRESDLVWGIFTANPKMGDGKALFHADHGNLAAAGAALSVDSIGAGREAMQNQKALDGKRMLSVRPDVMIVPSKLETKAEQFVAQNLVPAKTTDVVPQSMRSLSIICEPRLDATSTTAWFLAASTKAARMDTIEVAHLGGQRQPFTETRNGFEVDGVQVKARQVVGAKAIDWRWVYKNPGA